MPALRSIIARWFRFGAVGGVATLIHAAVLFILVEHVRIGAKSATVLGYTTAGVAAYFGHYYITFRATDPHRQAFPGFAISAMSGAALNVAIFAIIMDGFGANYWIAFAWVIVIVPGVTYCLAKWLAFGG
ncbi:MAG: GtrA family protein [Pseudomonadota bacterium]